MDDLGRIREYYGKLYREQDRLSTREGKLELERTKELLARHSPPASGPDHRHRRGHRRLCRLACVPGVLGPSDRHRAGARRGCGGLWNLQRDDGRCALAFRSRCASFDAALLLGPLYHLRRREERLGALHEAQRVVRHEGVVAAAFITRSAAVIDGFVNGWLRDPRALVGTEAALREGARPPGATDSAPSPTFTGRGRPRKRSRLRA